MKLLTILLCAVMLSACQVYYKPAPLPDDQVYEDYAH